MGAEPTTKKNKGKRYKTRPGRKNDPKPRKHEGEGGGRWDTGLSGLKQKRTSSCGNGTGGGYLAVLCRAAFAPRRSRGDNGLAAVTEGAER